MLLSGDTGAGSAAVDLTASAPADHREIRRSPAGVCWDFAQARGLFFSSSFYFVIMFYCYCLAIVFLLFISFFNIYISFPIASVEVLEVVRGLNSRYKGRK